MRKKHLLHHQYLKTPSDPEAAMLQYNAFQFPKSILNIVLLVILDLSGIQFLVVLIKQLSRKSLKSILLILIIISTCALVMFYFSILMYFILLWFIPYCTIYQLLNRIRLATEHYHIPDDIEPTRSIHCNFIEQCVFSPYKIGYHAEHHLYPSVPFYNLPKLSKLLKENNVVIYSERSYITALKELIYLP